MNHDSTMVSRCQHRATILRSVPVHCTARVNGPPPRATASTGTGRPAPLAGRARCTHGRAGRLGSCARGRDTCPRASVRWPGSRLAPLGLLSSLGGPGWWRLVRWPGGRLWPRQRVAGWPAGGGRLGSLHKLGADRRRPKRREPGTIIFVHAGRSARPGAREPRIILVYWFPSGGAMVRRRLCCVGAAGWRVVGETSSGLFGQGRVA